MALTSLDSMGLMLPKCCPKCTVQILRRARATGGRFGIATRPAIRLDPNLAARYADRVLLLYGDGRRQGGSAAELLMAPVLNELYLAPMIEGEVAGRRVFMSG